MRNAMAHGGVELLPKADCEIEELQIVNVDPDVGIAHGGRFWRSQMFAIPEKFVETTKTLKKI